MAVREALEALPPRPTPEQLELARRLPPELATEILRALGEAKAAPRITGRRIVIELALDRDADPTWRGSGVHPAFRLAERRPKR